MQIPHSVKRLIPYLKILKKSRNQAKFIRRLPSPILSDIADLLCNIVFAKLPLQHKQIQKLEPYKKPLLKLAKLPSKNKRVQFIYKQKGGFITSVLPIAASILAGVIANAV